MYVGMYVCIFILSSLTFKLLLTFNKGCGMMRRWKYCYTGAFRKQVWGIQFGGLDKKICAFHYSEIIWKIGRIFSSFTRFLALFPSFHTFHTFPSFPPFPSFSLFSLFSSFSLFFPSFSLFFPFFPFFPSLSLKNGSTPE